MDLFVPSMAFILNIFSPASLRSHIFSTSITYEMYFLLVYIFFVLYSCVCVAVRSVTRIKKNAYCVNQPEGCVGDFFLHLVLPLQCTLLSGKPSQTGNKSFFVCIHTAGKQHYSIIFAHCSTSTSVNELHNCWGSDVPKAVSKELWILRGTRRTLVCVMWCIGWCILPEITEKCGNTCSYYSLLAG